MSRETHLNQMIKRVKSLLTEANELGQLKQKKFFLMHINILCQVDDEKFLPCEIALLQFNLQVKFINIYLWEHLQAYYVAFFRGSRVKSLIMYLGKYLSRYYTNLNLSYLVGRVKNLMWMFPYFFKTSWFDKSCTVFKFKFILFSGGHY